MDQENHEEEISQLIRDISEVRMDGITEEEIVKIYNSNLINFKSFLENRFPTLELSKLSDLSNKFFSLISFHKTHFALESDLDLYSRIQVECEMVYLEDKANLIEQITSFLPDLNNEESIKKFLSSLPEHFQEDFSSRFKDEETIKQFEEFHSSNIENKYDQLINELSGVTEKVKVGNN